MSEKVKKELKSLHLPRTKIKEEQEKLDPQTKALSLMQAAKRRPRKSKAI